MNKKILIAGGNSGVGLKTVEKLVASGASVACAGRSTPSGENLEDIEFIEFDAGSDAAIPALPETIDGLAYFPGTITLKPFHGLKPEDFRQDFEINLLGAVRLIQAALPALKRSGSASVVLFSTVAVQTGLPFHASIAAAKGAVEGLVRSLAAELAPKIRVNGIAPSLTDTPLAANLLSSDQKVQSARDRHPLGRIGDPEDTAALVEFLLGDASKFITGQIIKPDGGLSALRLL